MGLRERVIPDTAESPEDIARLARRIFSTDFALDRGVLHVTAVWLDDEGGYTTLRITPDTPSHPYDQFALNLARGRADAIVTTGKILREEPDLTHGFLGPGALRLAMTRWRTEALGKERPPLSVVLTRGSSLDFEHPLFHSDTAPLVFTSAEAEARLSAPATEAGVAVAGVDAPSIVAAIRYLREHHGASTIAIEAGPETSRALYTPRLLVDELLLSVCRVSWLPDRLRGGSFFDQTAIERLFPARTIPFTAEAGRTTWTFQRFGHGPPPSPPPYPPSHGATR